jgi:uncharacterized OB-fold protein
VNYPLALHWVLISAQWLRKEAATMTSPLEAVTPLTLKGQIRMPYTWSVGATGSRFLVALRDRAVILGNRCDRCGTVYVPPRKNCGRCFLPIDAESWREVGPQGVVETFTVVRRGHALHPVPAPFAYALIRLDGADVGFLHIVRTGLDRLEAGVRVRAVFAARPSGNILDIEGFAPC